MAKIHLVDTFRNIRKQIISWLSIIVISSFALTAYLGLTFSARALADAGKTLYDSTNYHDIQITSNCLISEDDLDAIKSTRGVSEAEGQLKVYGQITTDAGNCDVAICSVPCKIDLPVIKEGKLPSSPDECILEQNLAEKLSLNIGDTISPLDAYNEEIIELSQESFTLTGTFVHAEHSSFDLDETYCLLVLPDAFDHGRFDDCYTQALITIDKPAYRSLFSKKYFDLADTFVDTFESLSISRAPERYAQYMAFLEDQIDDSAKELSDAKSQLSFVSRTIPSLQGKTGAITADLSNMLSVLIYEDPSEYKTASEQTDAYYEAVTEYENAVKRVDEAKKQHEKLNSSGECVWYVFNRNASIDFVNLRTNSENLEKLNMSFSILFIIIAIMVVFASLSRMVYEQRTLIGISKALGLRFAEIYSKYFVFGFSAAILGIILGVVLSLYVIEGVIALGYEDHFVFGRFPFMIDIYPTVCSCLIAVIIATTSIYLSCAGLMKKSAKKLLSPLVPKGHGKSLEKSPIIARLSLYNRLILLNVQSDIVRVIVTIISIAGCCSLMVIGFTLRFSIMGALERQLSDFTLYDGIIELNTSLYDDAADSVGRVLDNSGITSSLFLHLHGSIQIDDTMEYSEFLISDDLESISDFHPLIDFSTGEIFTSYPDEGLLITNRLSELYHLKIGDTIMVIDNMGYKHPARVSGVIKNYMGRYIVLKKNYYEKLLNDSFKDNAYFIRCTDTASADELVSKLSETPGFKSYSPSSELASLFENLLIVLNLIVGLLIVLAGVMAMFVLLNLANMYLITKRTELVVMRINGFTVTETVSYAIREVIFTTTMGIIMGVAFGIVMANSILRNMEQVHLMFLRAPSIPSCIIGAAITAVFASAIYAFSMRKVKDLSLKDSLT